MAFGHPALEGSGGRFDIGHDDRQKTGLRQPDGSPAMPAAPGRDEIDHAGPPACPVQAAFEQHVGNGTCFHRRRCIQIDMPLKHP